jgi:hypothetical protein
MAHQGGRVAIEHGSETYHVLGLELRDGRTATISTDRTSSPLSHGDK